MKTLLIILFYFVSNGSIAQPVFDKWTAIKEFHEVLAQTFHPTEERNLEPLKLRSEELMNKGSDILKKDIPEEYRTNSILALLEKLQMLSKQLHILIISKASDEIIIKTITQIHSSFHEIVGLCNEENR